MLRHIPYLRNIGLAATKRAHASRATPSRRVPFRFHYILDPHTRPAPKPRLPCSAPPRHPARSRRPESTPGLPVPSSSRPAARGAPAGRRAAVHGGGGRAGAVVVPQQGGDRAVAVQAGRRARRQGGQAPDHLLQLHPRRRPQAQHVSIPFIPSSVSSDPRANFARGRPIRALGFANPRPRVAFARLRVWPRRNLQSFDAAVVCCCRPQITIATGIILCHRFYLHQSHVKNEWQVPPVHGTKQWQIVSAHTTLNSVTD